MKHRLTSLLLLLLLYSSCGQDECMVLPYHALVGDWIGNYRYTSLVDGEPFVDVTKPIELKFEEDRTGRYYEWSNIGVELELELIYDYYSEPNLVTITDFFPSSGQIRNKTTYNVVSLTEDSLSLQLSRTVVDTSGIQYDNTVKWQLQRQ